MPRSDASGVGLARRWPADMEGSEPLSAAQRVALAGVRLYQVLFSPLFAGSCRFLPSCSAYAHDAIVEHGALRGIWLAARRLARCHPLGSSGFDPVPGRGARD
jgi:putative membrane protein insertion efficiency factor